MSYAWIQHDVQASLLVILSLGRWKDIGFSKKTKDEWKKPSKYELMLTIARSDGPNHPRKLSDLV